MEPQSMCPHCNSNVSISDLFCPSCGKKIKEKLISTSILTQILIYSFSIILTPLGIIPAIKYLRQKDIKAKNIGVIALVLTIISALIIGYLTINLFNSFSTQLGQQINLYQDYNF